MIRAGIGQTFGAFSIGLFRLHWLLTVMAFMAFSMSFGAVTPAVARAIGGDNSSVALAVAGQGIAWFFIGPYAGALTDRLSKRRLIAIAQTVIAITFAVLGLLIFVDRITILALTVSGLLMGACFAFTGPARRAYVADIVPPRLVGNGVALLQTGLTFPQSVAPVLASLLLLTPFVGADGAYFVMAGILVVTIGGLYLMPPGAPRSVARGSVTREILLGLRYAAAQPRIRILLLALLLMTAATGPYQALLPGMLEEELGLDASNIGLLTWPLGLGSFVAGLSVAGVVGTSWSGRVMFGMGVAFGLGVAGLGLAPSPLTMLPAVFVIGSGFSAFQTLNTAEAIQQSEPQFHGRITSLTFLPFGVQSFATLAIGPAADWVGVRPVLIVMGLSGIAISLFFGTLYLRTRDQPLSLPRAALQRTLRPIAAMMRPQK